MADNRKPSGVAYLALILVIILIIAIIIAFVFIFVREDIQIPGVRLTIQTGSSSSTGTGTTTVTSGTVTTSVDTYDTSEKDIYVSRNSNPLTLTLKPGAKGETGRVIAVKNNGAKTTDIITLLAGSGLTLRDGGLGKTISQGSTAELIAMNNAFIYLRLS